MKKQILFGLAMVMGSSAALAGGFDRGGVKIDQLFDQQRFTYENEVTYVFPQRTIKNVERVNNLGGGLGLQPQQTSSIDVDSDYVVPRIGFKVALGDSVDCLASYSHPYGADAEYGLNNAYSPTAVEFSVESEDFGLTCAYKIQTSIGQFRAIGGVSYLEVDAFQSRQTFGDLAILGDVVTIPTPPNVPPIPAVNTQGLGIFQLSDEAFGWRVGAAYEIPEIALRASLVYSSRYELDGLSGTVDTTAVGGFGTITPVSASTEIPQALEFKFQTGINPKTLLFGSVKWQQWSNLGIVPISGVTSPTTGQLLDNISFDPLYRDGITASVGVGRRFNEKLSGQAAFGYDRGTSTISGSQTDTYTLSGGISFTPTDNLELKLGGLVGLLTSGSSSPSGGDPANDLNYTFDDDFVGAVNLSAKLRF